MEKNEKLFTQFLSEVENLRKKQFSQKVAHAKQCKHNPPCLAPLFYLPIVPATIKRYFDAGMSPSQATKALENKNKGM